MPNAVRRLNCLCHSLDNWDSASSMPQLQRFDAQNCSQIFGSLPLELGPSIISWNMASTNISGWPQCMQAVRHIPVLIPTWQLCGIADAQAGSARMDVGMLSGKCLQLSLSHHAGTLPIAYANSALQALDLSGTQTRVSRVHAC